MAGKEPESLDELTIEKLIKINKANIVNKLKADEVVPAKDFEYLEQLEERLRQKKEACQKKETPPPEPPQNSEDIGIPERLRIKRKYFLSAAALEQRRKAAQSPERAKAQLGNKNAWKHGKYTQGFVESFIRPCKSTCEDYSER